MKYILLVILITSLFYISNSNDQDIANTESFDTPQIPEIQQPGINEDIQKDTEIKTTSELNSDPEQWQTRQSVTVDLEYRSNIIQPNDDIPSILPLTWSTHNPEYYYETGLNDGGTNSIYGSGAAAADVNLLYNAKIYAGQVGTLSYDFTHDTSATAAGTYQTANETITSSYINSEGYITIGFDIIADGGANQVSSYFSIMNYDTLAFETLASYTQSATFSTITDISLKIDQLAFTPDTITSQYRSEYKYTSDTTIQHRLDIDAVDDNTKIVIYKPENWDYSSVSPSATVSEVSGNIEIQGVANTNYEVLFTQISNFFMALEDVTDNYLSHPSFEGGNDWDNTNSPFTYDQNFELKSDIVYSGSSSLYLYDTSGAATTNIYVPSGSYYISFSYYFLTAGTTPKLSVWDDSISNWNYFNLDTTLNKWHTEFLYITVDGAAGGTRALEFITTVAEWYLDDFRIWIPSGNIETVALNEYDISGSFISWDGVENPALTNHDVELSFRDTTDTELASTTLTTDSNGIASYIYENSLSSQEYEVQFWSWDSWFSDFATEKLNDPFDFEEDKDGFTGVSGSFSIASVTNADGLLTYALGDTSPVGANEYYRAGGTTTTAIDYDYHSNLILKASINNTYTDYGGISPYIYLPASGKTTDTYIFEDFTQNNTYKRFTWDFSNTTIAGSESEIWLGFYIFSPYPSELHMKIDVEYLKLVNDGFYQKSYITPISSEDQSSSTLYETEDSYFLTSTNDTGLHYVEIDNYFGYFTDLEFIPMNLTTGNHSLNYIRIYDYSILSENYTAQLPGSWNNITYTISETIEKTLVHFFLSNLAGVGLDFTTAQLWINDSRMYSEEWFYDPGTLLNITVKTLFNTTIFNEEVTVESATDQDIILVIPLFIQYFVNSENIPVYVHMNHTYFNTSFVLNANESIQMFVIESTYNFTISALKDTVNNGTHIFTYTSKTLTNVSLPDVDRRVYFSLSLSAEEVGGDDTINLTNDPIITTLQKVWNAVSVFFLIGLGYLLGKLIQAVIESTGMSVVNILTSIFTGKKLYKMKEYSYAEKRPDRFQTTSGYLDEAVAGVKKK